MADIETPVEVGFAEFITRLMSEVFDSIISTHVEQEQRFVDMLNATSLSVERYAEVHVSDEDVDEELAIRFPPREMDTAEQGSAVYSGAPYQPASGDMQEDPPILAETGLTMERNMYTISRAGGAAGREGGSISLNAAGVQAVRHAVRIGMAEQQLSIARELLARGIPRLMVDSGRINGKLTFNLVREQGGENATETGQAPELPRVTTPLRTLKGGRLFAAQRARVLPDVRMLVKQADDRSPQASQLSTNVYGEVEITFKTVT